MKQLRVFLFVIYLSIGPVVWFPGLNVGLIKLVLIIFLSVFSIGYFVPANIKGFLFFVLIASSVGICLYINNKGDDCSLLIKGVIENFVVFNISYNLMRDGLVKKKHLLVIVSIISFFAFLTITNFIIGFPDWKSPISELKAEELTLATGQIQAATPLWSSGFGLGRTGWCNCLALYLPICFYLIFSNYRKSLGIVCVLCIIGSILFGGSKGATFIIILMTSLYLWRTKLISPQLFVFLAVCGALLLWYNIEGIAEHYRLNDGDISTGRLDQLELVPKFLSQYSFWGLGYGKTQILLSYFLGEEWSLHNTYLRIVLEFGVLVGGLVFVLVMNVYRYFFRIIKKTAGLRDDFSFYLSLVLIGGTIVGLFEPLAVFGALSWYSIWWSSFGMLSFAMSPQFSQASSIVSGRPHNTM